MTVIRAAALFAALAISAAVAAPAMAQTRTGARTEEQKAPQQKVVQPRSQQEKVFPVSVTWAAVSLNGKRFSGERPSLILDAQFRMRGFAGCNTFSATSYPLREQRLAVGPVAFTKKACDKATMASEQAFLTALRTSMHWDLVQSVLVVKTQNGELRFERAL